MRLAALFLLFVPINALWNMLSGPVTEVGQLADQFGPLAICGALLQPWLFLLGYALDALPEPVALSLFRWAFRGAPLPLVVITSAVSAGVYYWMFRLLPRIPFLRGASRRVPRFVPAAAYAIIFIIYSAADVYVAVHRVPFHYSP